MIQDDAQHVVSLTGPQQKLALLFLDQHLAPAEVMAKGSLAVALNGQSLPRKEGAREGPTPALPLPSLSSFLLFPCPTCWFRTPAGKGRALNPLGTRTSPGS